MSTKPKKRERKVWFEVQRKYFIEIALRVGFVPHQCMISFEQIPKAIRLKGRRVFPKKGTNTKKK